MLTLLAECLGQYLWHCDKSLRALLMDKVSGENKCGVNKCLLQGTGEHSAPTWQLAELDPGFRGHSAQKIFSLLKKMIWQFIVQKYIFHLNQEAWHSLCWRLAPERVGRNNYNGCIWEAEWLDDLKMCVDEVLRDVGWNPLSQKTWQLYWRRIQKLFYLVGCKRCEFRSWLGCWLPLWFQGRNSKGAWHVQKSSREKF